MQDTSLENLLKLSAEERLDFFITKVADSGEVWGLFDEGWAMATGEDDSKVLVLWPEKEIAELCRVEAWASFEPKSIELNLFIEKWLVGMSDDGLKAGVFPLPSDKGVVLDSMELREEMLAELDAQE